MGDPPVARLVWAKGNGHQPEFPLDREVLLVGRDDTADIRIDEPLVSRAHARIERRGPRYFVIDLGSTNYTRVNGTVVSEQELKHGDEVLFGRARCLFQLEGAPFPPAHSGPGSGRAR
jgi:pSer/pThr/pTyr-binding forkhead associated (FHA) protein